MKNIPLPTIIIGAILIVILLAQAFTYEVRYSEVALKLRFGQVTEGSVITEPGLKFKLLWPIETVEHFDARLRAIDTPEQEMKTRDQKNVIVGCYALWRIADPVTFYKASSGNERTAIDRIQSRLTQYSAAAIGNREMSFLVNLDEQQLERNWEQLEQSLMAQATPTLEEDFGVELVAFQLRRTSLPEETTETVFEQMRKEREIIATGYQREGEAQAAAIKNAADGQAQQIRAFAERRAQEIRSEGLQQSTRYLAEIEQQDPEFYQWLQWLDATKAALEQRAVIFLDSESPWFKILNDMYGPQGVPQPGELGRAAGGE
jgi:modulator of FtsH protease HflC